MKFASQLWRFARLAGVGAGHSAWVAVLNLPTQDKTAVAVAALAATEVAYRQVFPAGKIGQFAKDIAQAYRVVKQIQAQSTKPAA